MTPTNPTDAQMKLAGRCATEAYKMAEDDRTTLHGYAVQSAMLAIQATEARAQGLVDALEEIGRKSDEPTTVEFLVSQALATWRRT